MCLGQEMCSDIIPWWDRGYVFRQGHVFRYYSLVGQRRCV